MSHNKSPKLNTFYKSFGLPRDNAFELAAEFNIKVVTECLCECSNHPDTTKVVNLIIDWKGLNLYERLYLMDYYRRLGNDYWYDAVVQIPLIIYDRGVLEAKQLLIDLLVEIEDSAINKFKAKNN